MKYVILDTNVVVSAMLSHLDRGYPAEVLRRVTERKIVPIYSTALMEEYEEVLRRKKFNFDECDITMVLAKVRYFGIREERLPGLTFAPACGDMDDQAFYDLLLSTDAILITGNIKHFPLDNKRIFTPGDFCQSFCF